MTEPRQALIGVGSNLGDRHATVAAAISRLRAQPGIVAIEASSIYETEPIGVTAQPRFLNAVVGIDTMLVPEELLKTLLAIEREFGRVRRERWGPRTLDLDLLAFEGETRAQPELTLPHPRMLERAFVTEPLRELLNLYHFRCDAWQALRADLARLPAAAGGVRKLTAGNP
ncbi:MAG TPA: 2-amino-4-hydroxy-6-hydroxymethyldihydropteridine diphosphokinase [Opitutus sp.]|nr:2-amino-4-hydroxy-6-hydroxymethyldihydropteridine diphosphokinase [Opitutus sp.]